jgi:hypothetical protein
MLSVTASDHLGNKSVIVGSASVVYHAALTALIGTVAGRPIVDNLH